MALYGGTPAFFAAPSPAAALSHPLQITPEAPDEERAFPEEYSHGSQSV